MPKYPISWWLALIIAFLEIVKRFLDEDETPTTEPTRANAGHTGNTGPVTFPPL